MQTKLRMFLAFQYSLGDGSVSWKTRILEWHLSRPGFIERSWLSLSSNLLVELETIPWNVRSLAQPYALYHYFAACQPKIRGNIVLGLCWKHSFFISCTYSSDILGNTMVWNRFSVIESYVLDSPRTWVVIPMQRRQGIMLRHPPIICLFMPKQLQNKLLLNFQRKMKSSPRLSS